MSGNSENDKRVLILAAEADAELAMWLVEIDRALTWNSRGTYVFFLVLFCII